MKQIPAAQAKTNFGALIDSAQREPAMISRNGRPVAVVMSVQEFEEYQALKLDRLRREVQIGLDQIDRGDIVDGKQAFDMLEDGVDA